MKKSSSFCRIWAAKEAMSGTGIPGAVLSEYSEKIYEKFKKMVAYTKLVC